MNWILIKGLEFDKSSSVASAFGIWCIWNLVPNIKSEELSLPVKGAIITLKITTKLSEI